MLTSIDALASLMAGRRTVVLTGAGISTDSGIPDYRGPETRKRARSPVQYNAFLSDEKARARYWMRSAVGWARFSAAKPNAGHYALAQLEQAGLIRGIITQNVDRLHCQAGSQRVVELHGALGEVQCLGCGALIARAHFQETLLALNPSWQLSSAALAPDGDAEVDAVAGSFSVPGCTTCGGVLKPHVVFFGENVPKARVEAAWSLYGEAEVLLVAGSSLAVYSGYRFVQRAARENRPVAIVTLGPTRGDRDAQLRMDAPLGQVLPALARHLLSPSLLIADY